MRQKLAEDDLKRLETATPQDKLFEDILGPWITSSPVLHHMHLTYAYMLREMDDATLSLVFSHIMEDGINPLEYDARDMADFLMGKIRLTQLHAKCLTA